MLRSLSKTGFFQTTDGDGALVLKIIYMMAILMMVLACTSNISWIHISWGQEPSKIIIFFINKVYNIILEGEIFRKI